MNKQPWILVAFLLVLALPLPAQGQLRRGGVRPAPIDHGRLAGPVRYHYIDTSWQNSPYTYYLIHHHGIPPFLPYYPPYYPAYYPPDYPPYDSSGYGPVNTLSDYYGGDPDLSNPYSSLTTHAVLPAIDGNNAVIHVKVPLALAEVTFDGTPTTTTGINRIFTTPELTPGKTYTYSVTANYSDGGLPVSLTKTVQVQAGQHTTVDFTQKGV